MAESETTLSGPWAARVGIADLMSASRLRVLEGIRVTADTEWLWLRGTSMNADLLRALHHIGPASVYSIGNDESLTAIGDLLPSGTLPPLPWKPIRDFYSPLPPPSLLSAVTEERVSLRLVSGGLPRAANALLSPLAELAGWAENATEIRLRRLRYAATPSHALVLGQPLPPIPGTRHYEDHGICIPSGYELQPAVDGHSLRIVLKLGEGDLAIFDLAGWQRIPGDAVVPMSRSSIRTTLAQGERR